MSGMVKIDFYTLFSMIFLKFCFHRAHESVFFLFLGVGGKKSERQRGLVSQALGNGSKGPHQNNTKNE